MITSVHNPKARWVRKLQDDRRFRRQENLFIVEGVRLAEEAMRSGWTAKAVFFTEDLSPRGMAIIEELRQRAPVEKVSLGVMRSMSDTETPQGVLVAVELKDVSLPPRLDFVFIPDQVRDPGNLGTMLRSAAAAGVQAVLLPPETTDPYAPKVVRAAMGAHFHLPVRVLDWEVIQQILSKNALTIYLAAMGQGVVYTDADFCKPLALIIGGEAEGAGERAYDLSQQWVHIPMPGGVESLNASAASAILFFEVLRQRSK